MAFVGTDGAPNLGASQWYNSVFKYAKMYIESGNLKSRFDIFESEEAVHGQAIETRVILAAEGKDLNDANPNTNNKYEEHAYYKGKVFTVVATDSKPRQYGITVSDRQINKVVHTEEEAQRFAAELVQSLYQGWISDKNKYLAAIFDGIITNATGKTTVNYPASGADDEKYAKAFLTAIKTKVKEFREGVTGASYGNAEVGQSEIASSDIVVIINSATASLLDSYGLASTFHDDYLKTDVTFVESSKIPENRAVIVDKRNIVLKKRFERLVDIPNSDGSYNWFLNVDFFIDANKNTAGTVYAFPVWVVEGVEAAG